MKSMRVGDVAFMYHSNANKRTGIVGIMKVVKDNYPDPTCLDLSFEFYDAKVDPSNIPWVMVDLQLVEIFSRPIYLDEMKTHSELNDMEIFRRTRLSTSRVTRKEFDFICNLGRNTEAPLDDTKNQKERF